MKKTTMRDGAQWFLRLGLAAGFLSAVADRFGLWGAPGSPGVAWGQWHPFVSYVGTLNWFVPEAFIPTLAGVATLAEVVLAVALVIGWKIRASAFASGMLLLAFAVTMTIASGVKGPLDYSVFVAAGGAFLLAATAKG